MSSYKIESMIIERAKNEKDFMEVFDILDPFKESIPLHCVGMKIRQYERSLARSIAKAKAQRALYFFLRTA